MNAANRLTILRILLVPVFIASLIYFTPERPYFYSIAVIVYLVACFTDALDGYLAKKLNQKTQLGSYIDPIADKLLLLSGYLSLSLIDHLPVSMHMPGWVTLFVISRDVVILIGSVIIFIATGALKAAPLFIGKLTTVMQMTALLASLLALPQETRTVLYFLTAALTVVSGILYIRIGGKILQDGAA